MLIRRLSLLLAMLLPVSALLVAAPTAATATTSIRTETYTVSRPVDSSADLDLPAVATHVATYWRGAPEARVSVAFSLDGERFSEPVDAGRDEAGEQRGNGITYGAVRVTGGARTVRVTSDRPLAQVWVDGMSDGERTVTRTAGPRAASAAVAQPTVAPRSAWGADESLRYNADGTLKQAPTYAPIKKLIVHHTDTTNSDPDPAATLRAIYRYHVVTQGWADIGYNFLVDESGRIWEGRWSRSYPAGTSPSGDDSLGRGVTGAHTSGWNTGTVGVALLGTLIDRDAAPAARTALVDLLAWESDRNALDPNASTAYTNPVSGATTTAPNIAGHRDYGATECPGGTFYATLPALRADVAARLAPAAPAPAPDTSAPSVPANLSATGGVKKVVLGWSASTDDTGVTDYLVSRSSTGSPGSFSQVATTTTLGYTDSGLRNGRTYYYNVRARDSAGNTSAAAATVSATTR